MVQGRPRRGAGRVVGLLQSPVHSVGVTAPGDAALSHPAGELPEAHREKQIFRSLGGRYELDQPLDYFPLQVVEQPKTSLEPEFILFDATRLDSRLGTGQIASMQLLVVLIQVLEQPGIYFGAKLHLFRCSCAPSSFKSWNN